MRSGKNWERYEEKVKMNEKEIIEGLIYEYGNHEAQLGMGGKENAELYFPKATEKQKSQSMENVHARLPRKQQILTPQQKKLPHESEGAFFIPCNPKKEGKHERNNQKLP